LCSLVLGTLDDGSVSPPTKKVSKKSKVSSDPPLPDLSREMTPTPASRPGSTSQTSSNSQGSTSSAAMHAPTSSGGALKPKACGGNLFVVVAELTPPPLDFATFLCYKLFFLCHILWYVAHRWSIYAHIFSTKLKD